MCNSRRHTQYREMIVRQEPRYGLPQSLPSKTCSGVISSAWAGHLMEKPLDVQLQVPYNRWTLVTSMIASLWCGSLSPPCLICFSPPSVVNTFFFMGLTYYFIWAFGRCGYSILSRDSGTESSRASKDPLACHYLCGRCRSDCAPLSRGACWAVGIHPGPETP